MEKLRRVLLLCFSILIFFGVSVQAITKEVIEEVRKSVVLLSLNTLKNPPVDARNALCSGTVINEQGHILTNFHCVYKQKTINMYYWSEDDWHEYTVKVIGEDPLADLVVLEVIGLKRKVPYLKFAKKEDIYSGIEVFALGHPMGMAWSLSKGIVSSIERYARHPYIKSVQVDAAINKGNSGGPVFNDKGEIVGIATLMVSRTDQNAGVGLAVRADVAEKSLAVMLEKGKVDRPALGIMIIPLYGKDNQREKILKDNPDINTSIPNTYGLLISDQNKPTDPLPKGLQAWDTVIGINNIAINNDVEFAEQLGKYKIGDLVNINILRDKRFIQVDNITLKVFPVQTDKMYGNRNLPVPVPNKEKK
jgi:serine protease Do